MYFVCMYWCVLRLLYSILRKSVKRYWNNLFFFFLPLVCSCFPTPVCVWHRSRKTPTSQVFPPSLKQAADDGATQREGWKMTGMIMKTLRLLLRSWAKRATQVKNGDKQRGLQAGHLALWPCTIYCYCSSLKLFSCLLICLLTNLLTYLDLETFQISVLPLAEMTFPQIWIIYWAIRTNQGLPQPNSTTWSNPDIYQVNWSHILYLNN